MQHVGTAHVIRQDAFFHAQVPLIDQNHSDNSAIHHHHQNHENNNKWEDWDCVEAVDIPAFQSHVLDTWMELWERMTGNNNNKDNNWYLLLVEGFLLHQLPQWIHQQSTQLLGDTIGLYVHFHVDLPVLLERRAQRQYLITKEQEENLDKDKDGQGLDQRNDKVLQYWTDPDGYVEHVVYPRYLEYHDSILRDYKDKSKNYKGEEEGRTGERDIAWTVVDTSELTQDQVMDQVLLHMRRLCPHLVLP